MRTHTLPDQRNDLAKYADSSLLSGAYISSSENHKTFNRSWGGYTGETEFPLFAVTSVSERSVRDWQEAGVKYAIPNYDTYLQLLDSDIGDHILNQTTLLKIFPPSDDYRGPSMVVLALNRMQFSAQGTLGPIELLGYDIDRITVQQGDSFTFQYYWRADAPLDTTYQVYNHLVPQNDRDIITQIDNPPHPTTKRGTQDWDDPTETIISRPFTMAIPDDTPPGTYRLLTGFYSPDTWQRLVTPDGEDYLFVTEITVTEAELDANADSSAE